MKKWWFGALSLALLLALGGMAVVFDRARATVRVTAGLEGELDEVESGSLPSPLEASIDSPSREAVRAQPAARRTDLELVVRRENGLPIVNAEVLAYRDLLPTRSELLRAGRTDREGVAHLLPFKGGAALQILRSSDEIARSELAEGRGRHEIVVPDGASIAGIVLVDGQPREDIGLELVTGLEETWSEELVREAFEDWGLRERTYPRREESRADGSFRFSWLSPDWSGALRLADTEHYRFAGGSKRLPLAQPAEGLVLELHERRAEPVIRGRVVLRGEPVPYARWRAESSVGSRSGSFMRSWSSLRSGRCDEQGTFSMPAHADTLELLRLEFFRHGFGVRLLERSELEAPHDLGDIELVPTRDLSFVVTSIRGEPIAGARALPWGDSDARRLRAWRGQEADGFLGSEPTDADGRGVLRSVGSAPSSISVGAPGYASIVVGVSGETPPPLAILLARVCTIEARLQDPGGQPAHGLGVRLTSAEPPFTWKSGFTPDENERTHGASSAQSWSRKGGGFDGRYRADAEGRVRIEALRAGVHYRLSVSDEYGTEVVAPRNIVLAPEETLSLDFVVTERPRALIATVRDSLSRPVSATLVRILPHCSPGTSSSSLVTDRAGMVRAQALYGSEVSLSFVRAGFETRTLQRLEVPPEGASVEVSLAHDWWPW